MKPLKILHVANRAENHSAKRYYSYANKMNNGFVRNGHCVYWFSDRDIARSNAIIPSKKFGLKKCNTKLLEVCHNFRPDLMVMAHADTIRNETIEEIKSKYKPIIVQYNFDPLHEHNRKILEKRNGFVDFNFITTGGSFLEKISKKGTKYSFMPNPVDRSIDCLHNYKSESLLIDAIFVGQTINFVDESDLRTQVSRLSQEVPKFNIGLYNHVWGDSYLNLLKQAKIGLSFSLRLGPEQSFDGDGSSHYLYSSDRISQYVGNGLLTFVESRFRLSDIYGKDCLVEVDDYNDLKEKIQFYATHDSLRRDFARKSHTLFHNEFNEKLVTQYIIEVAIDAPLSHSYRWPTDVWSDQVKTN